MNSVKIEMGSILALKNVIFRHELLNDFINDNDKEPSWDGFIYLYKTEEQKAEDIVYRVPVQIKGKNDQESLKKKVISYPVEYKHLRNYYKDGGVFYIVVVISNNGEKTSIFYDSLTTVKLAYLLKGTEKKRANQTKNITLQRLEKNDSAKMYRLLTQFGVDREKQGMGNGEIIKNAINIGEMSKIDCIKAVSYSANNELELLKEITTGEIGLYGHRADIDMWLPFDYSHQTSMIYKHVVQIDKEFGIDGVNYYDSYCVEKYAPKDEYPILRLSENLSLDFMRGKINFETIDDVITLVKDAKFLNALNNGKSIYINNKKVIDITNVNIPQSMKNKIQLIQDLWNAFEEIGYTCTKKFSDFTDRNWSSINELLNLYGGKIKPQKGSEHSWYIWHWDETIVPLLLNDEDGEIEIINWFTTKKYCIFVDKEKKYRLPRFVLFKRDILEKLYDVEERVWIEEIEKIECIEKIVPELYQYFVELVAAYDIVHKEKYYNIAQIIIDKVLEVCPEDEYAIINKMQLVKRKRDLTEEQINVLEKIEEKTDDLMIKCAVNILLENKRKAQKTMLELSEEKQKEMKSFPIYNLLEVHK